MVPTLCGILGAIITPAAMVRVLFSMSKRNPDKTTSGAYAAVAGMLMIPAAILGAIAGVLLGLLISGAAG